MSNLIAEIAARYGVGIAPDARVTQVAQGVSGLPVPVWVGNRLIYPDWDQRKKATSAVAVKNAKIWRADRNRADAAALARIAELVGAGCSGPEIAGDTGLKLRAVYDLVKHLGLKIARKGSDGAAIVAHSEARRAVREAKIRDLVAKGATLPEIGAALGIQSDRYVRAAVLKVCPGHQFPRRKSARSAHPEKTAAEQRKRTASRDAAVARHAARVALADQINRLLPTHSFAQIADVTGLSRSAVAAKVSRLRKAGLLPPVDDPKAADRARIEATIIAHAATHSAAAIGAMIGLSKASVSGRMETLIKAGRISAPDPTQPKICLPPKPRAPKLDKLAHRNDVIVTMFEADRSAVEIAAALGITRRAVWGALRKRGKLSRKKHIQKRDERLSVLPDLVAKGLPISEIASALNLSPKSVYSLASRNGLSFANTRAASRKAGKVGDQVAARRAKVAEMVKAGRKYTEIMAATGFGRNTIWADIRALGLTGQTAYSQRKGAVAVNDDLRAAILKAYRAGNTYREIAAEIGISWWSVGRIVREAEASGKQRKAA